MVFSQTHEGKTYQKIPDAVLQKNIETLKSLKAVYMYAKILMLRDKVYKREYWVTNPISKEKEMSIDTMSFITGRLEMADLIRINKLEMEDKDMWPINSYEIVPYACGYKPVFNDFINHTGLSADAKGLGILLSLLKNIPKSNSGIGKSIGISDKTVKKYLAELTSSGIYNQVTHQLSEEYFPFNQQCRSKHENTILKAYNNWIQKTDNELPEREKRQRDYVLSIAESEKVKARIYYWSVMPGLMGRRQKEDETHRKQDEFIIL